MIFVLGILGGCLTTMRPGGQRSFSLSSNVPHCPPDTPGRLRRVMVEAANVTDLKVRAARP